MLKESGFPRARLAVNDPGLMGSCCIHVCARVRVALGEWDMLPPAEGGEGGLEVVTVQYAMSQIII